MITKNDPPSDYSWAKPFLTIDRVMRLLVRLSTVSLLTLVILIVLVSSWRLVWSSVWSPNLIIRLLVVAVAAAAIVILVGKGSGTGGGSASIVTWRFAIVRVAPWNPSVSAVVGRWSWGVWSSPAVVFLLVLFLCLTGSGLVYLCCWVGIAGLGTRDAARCTDCTS